MMTDVSEPNIFVGKWSYRSFLNEPDLSVQPDSLLFGMGTIEIVDAPMNILKGTIGGSGWSLELHGSRSYGSRQNSCKSGHSRG